MLTSKKLTLTASDSGFEAIKSSGKLVGFDSDSYHANSSPGEGAMKINLFLNLKSLNIDSTKGFAGW